jgi:hypothetical protein
MAELREGPSQHFLQLYHSGDGQQCYDHEEEQASILMPSLTSAQ